MGKSKFIIKADKYLFDSDQALVKLTPHEYEKLIRYRACFTHWLENSHLSDKDIVAYLIEHYDLSSSQAYRDIFDIKLLLGNVVKARKEWERYRATNMINEGFALAKDAKDKIDIMRAEAMIKAGKAMAPVQKLSIVEPDEVDWEHLQVPNFEPVYDPALITDDETLKNVEDVTEKLKRDLGLITDAEIVE